MPPGRALGCTSDQKGCGHTSPGGVSVRGVCHQREMERPGRKQGPTGRGGGHSQTHAGSRSLTGRTAEPRKQVGSRDDTPRLPMRAVGHGGRPECKLRQKRLEGLDVSRVTPTGRSGPDPTGVGVGSGPHGTLFSSLVRAAPVWARPSLNPFPCSGCRLALSLFLAHTGEHVCALRASARRRQPPGG